MCSVWARCQFNQVLFNAGKIIAILLHRVSCVILQLTQRKLFLFFSHIFDCIHCNINLAMSRSCFSLFQVHGFILLLLEYVLNSAVSTIMFISIKCEFYWMQLPLRLLHTCLLQVYYTHVLFYLHGITSISNVTCSNAFHMSLILCGNTVQVFFATEFKLGVCSFLSWFYIYLYFYLFYLFFP